MSFTRHDASPRATHELRRLLERRRQDLLDKASATQGHVDAQEFEEVDRLEKLVDASRPTRRLLVAEVLDRKSVV